MELVTVRKDEKTGWPKAKIFEGHGARVEVRKMEFQDKSEPPFVNFKLKDMPGGNLFSPTLNYELGRFGFNFDFLSAVSKEVTAENAEAIKKNIDALVAIVEELKNDPEFADY